MAFQPDILINTSDGRVMVVEAKLKVHDLARTQEALKQYMVGMQYPFGLLITPKKGWVYRDSYSGLASSSVTQVEEFDSTKLWHHSPPQRELEFEAFVQQWLESLTDFPMETLPPKLREIVQSYLVPAIANGEVRAAHPR
jgi:hypothetical protein